MLGLRGTGSIDYTMTDVFVPEEFCHFAFTRDGSRGDIYRLGIIAIAVVCHSGWAMGVGRRLLDELQVLVAAKKGRAGSIAESDHFQTQFAENEAAFRAARAFVMEAWRDVEQPRSREPIRCGRTRSCASRSPHRKTLLGVANFVYLAGGTTAAQRANRRWCETCTPAPSASPQGRRVAQLRATRGLRVACTAAARPRAGNTPDRRAFGRWGEGRSR